MSKELASKSPRLPPRWFIRLAGGQRPVRGRAAVGAERTRLWERWRQIDANLDGYAAMRSSQTAVVILEPRPEG